jgi:hypothetical protein
MRSSRPGVSIQNSTATARRGVGPEGRERLVPTPLIREQSSSFERITGETGGKEMWGIIVPTRMRKVGLSPTDGGAK